MRDLVYKILGSVLMILAPVCMQLLDILSKEVVLILALVFFLCGLIAFFVKQKRICVYSFVLSAVLTLLWLYCVLMPKPDDNVAEMIQNPIESFLYSSQPDGLKKYKERDPATLSYVAEQIIRLREKSDMDVLDFMYYDRLRKDVEEAASQNYAGAFYVLGLMHSKGLGCPKDNQLAATYLSKCIDLKPEEPAPYFLLQSLGPDILSDLSIREKMERWEQKLDSVKSLAILFNEEVTGKKKMIAAIKSLHKGDTNSTIYKMIKNHRSDFDILNTFEENRLSIILASYCYGIGAYDSCAEYYDKAIETKSTVDATLFLKYYPDTLIETNSRNYKKIMLYSSDIQYMAMINSAQKYNYPFLTFATALSLTSKNKYLYDGNTLMGEGFEDSTHALRKVIIKRMTPLLKNKSEFDKGNQTKQKTHYYFDLTDAWEWVDKNVRYDDSIVYFLNSNMTVYPVAVSIPNYPDSIIVFSYDRHNMEEKLHYKYIQ